ncbi:hypothetical protein LTT02_28490 [Mycolicibacterium smegmatis]|uniref:hypothetical protein n=1 Tax=Mycolicibacterium smegmatis TaxID=1772 RepID=UPI0005D84A78|nr:hypothetical protein [Mycolicibacterium smegmatis]MDF1899950.1 hypothetical protein [Mycolicibacterium smegmatis]MDF1906654.1 hypothetical protein [Mycolicibacterium smegmatis]MDF1916133.1 hypothetical protein [Mycolicibacterium smegmatis]MDF1925130.1 hypothetical protein [Mycolicibacterium smegmatis]UAK56540.1 hypothetical protein K8P01_07310 [Mycolicibacterium smegmatis]
MTLIVAAVVGNWAFHASDRFVSVEPTPDNPTGEYDPHSNKTVVVLGIDCWVVLGYTGLAFLDGKPTDRLIAEAISGYDELAPAMMTFWQPPPDLHYREIRNRVENALRDAYSHLLASEKKRATIVLASGVQRKDGMVTKVMFRTKAQGDSVTSIEMRPDTQQFKAFYIDAVGMVNNPIIDRAKARLTALSCPADEVPDQVRDILRDAVLETSALTDKVGDNVMTVVLDKPGQAIRTGLYISDRQRQAELFEKARQQEPDMLDQFAERLTVSTPYVMMPGGIWGPSIGNPGGWDTNGITFDYTGFDNQPGSGGGAFFGVQPRRDGP